MEMRWTRWGKGSGAVLTADLGDNGAIIDGHGASVQTRLYVVGWCWWYSRLDAAFLRAMVQSVQMVDREPY